MNGEDKKPVPNLNTIYEEFDLSDRIKALKGKHIKIKKIVKKDDGNYTLKESSLFSEKSMEMGLNIDAGSPDFRQKDTLPYISSSSNILPSEMAFQKQQPPGSSDYQFKKSAEMKPFSFGVVDYASGLNFKREPVMPLSSSYTPVGNSFGKEPLKDLGRQNSDLFSSG